MFLKTARRVEEMAESDIPPIGPPTKQTIIREYMTFRWHKQRMHMRMTEKTTGFRKMLIISPLLLNAAEALPDADSFLTVKRPYRRSVLSPGRTSVGEMVLSMAT